MKVSHSAAKSTGHGTGLVQRVPLYRSALRNGKVRPHRRVVLGARLSERELAIRALLEKGQTKHQRARLIENHRGRWPFKATPRRRRADTQVAA